MLWPLVNKINQKKCEVIINDKFFSNNNIKILKKKTNFYFFFNIYKKKKYKVLVSTGEPLSLKITFISVFKFFYAITFGNIIEKTFLKNFLLRVFNRPFSGQGLDCKLTKPFFPFRELGDISVRLSDGSDLKIKNFPPNIYKNLFDIFFCYLDIEKKKIIQKLKNKICKKIDYFTFKNIKKNKDFFSRFKNFKKSKKTILWLPTYIDTPFEKDKNISLWISKLSFLTKKYNFLIRPHPRTIVNNYEIVNILNDNNFILDLGINSKISYLIQNSDLVLCDYGGTILGSLYLKKPVIFLNFLINSRFVQRLKNTKSLEYRLRNKLINLNLNCDEKNISHKIQQSFKKFYKKKIIKCKKKLFGIHKSLSLNQTADFLIRKLDE